MRATVCLDPGPRQIGRARDHDGALVGLVGLETLDVRATRARLAERFRKRAVDFRVSVVGHRYFDSMSSAASSASRSASSSSFGVFSSWR